MAENVKIEMFFFFLSTPLKWEDILLVIHFLSSRAILTVYLCLTPETSVLQLKAIGSDYASTVASQDEFRSWCVSH